MKTRRLTPKGLKRRAFTLIEIMMVVAIVGLTLVMGLPAFLHTMHREGMRKAEYDLVEACKEARRAAIMSNETKKLVIHPLLGTFEVPGAYPMTQLPPDVLIEILGVNFIELEHADLAEVSFSPKGFSDEFTILLRAADGQTLKLSLDTVTALPNVEMVN
jgi:prepilin-type N-terminal cleavage/methylation domain-containing protein